MRLTRHSSASRPGLRSPQIALASCAAAGVLLLTGCDLLSPSSSDPTPAANPTQDRTAVAATSAAATPTQTPDASPSDSASTSPDAAQSESSAVAVTRYSDKTSVLQLPVSDESLPGAPAGLVDFARTQLTAMWHDQFQGDLGCQGIAQVRIKRTLPTSAYVEASWGDLTPTCPQYAGNPGWWEVWTTDGSGSWSVALKGEGTAACEDLVAASIPRSIYPSCSDGTKKVANPVG